MRSTVEIYTQHYANQLTPETEQILARLSDDALRLVRATLDADWTSPLDADWTSPEEDPRECLARMRRNEPALNSLSDEELDVALNVVCHLGAEGHAAEEYLAESHEFMTEEERERFSIIASWAV